MDGILASYIFRLIGDWTIKKSSHTHTFVQRRNHSKAVDWLMVYAYIESTHYPMNIEFYPTNAIEMFYETKPITQERWLIVERNFHCIIQCSNNNNKEFIVCHFSVSCTQTHTRFTVFTKQRQTNLLLVEISISLQRKYFSIHEQGDLPFSLSHIHEFVCVWCKNWFCNADVIK